jgi:hypothetical protein
MFMEEQVYAFMAKININVKNVVEKVFAYMEDINIIVRIVSSNLSMIKF